MNDKHYRACSCVRFHVAEIYRVNTRYDLSEDYKRSDRFMETDFKCHIFPESLPDVETLLCMQGEKLATVHRT